MKAYQLIEPDGTEGEVYLGEQGRIYVMRFCRHNPGWTWREVDDIDLPARFKTRFGGTDADV